MTSEGSELEKNNNKKINFRDQIFNLSNDFLRLKRISQKLNLAQLEQYIDDHLDQIKKDNFSIAVVGEFKRGKSTFINAILGKEILPSDILPTSATLNRVSYGLKPEAKIIFRGDGPENERSKIIELVDLVDYVTKLTPDAQAMAAKVQEAIVYYPIPYLRHSNVDIIDTPGLEDENAMTDVTMSVIPTVDAAIFVIMPQAPFAGSEGEFLKILLEHGLGRVIFVVTAMDRILRVKERERLVPAITERIQRTIETYVESLYEKDSEAYHRQLQRIGKPKVFGLSGYQALQAKIANDEELLTESKFPEFEEMLEIFLTEETGLISLQRRANHLFAYSKEILMSLSDNIKHAPRRRHTYAGRYEEFIRLLDVIQQLGQDKLAFISNLPDEIQKRMNPIIYQFRLDLKQEAEKAIDNFSLDGQTLEPEVLATTTNQLGVVVDQTVRKAAYKWKSRITKLIHWEWSLALNQLVSLATTTDYTLHYIQGEVTQINEELTIGNEKKEVNLYAPGPLVTRFQVHKGFNQGQGDHMEMVESTDRLNNLFEIQEGWIQQFFFDIPPKKRFVPNLLYAQQYRTAYKEAVVAEILEKYFPSLQIAGTLQKFVQYNFGKLAEEVKMTRTQSHQTQYDIQGFLERLNLVVEQEVMEYQHMQTEVERISNSARQLVQQIGV